MSMHFGQFFSRTAWLASLLLWVGTGLAETGPNTDVAARARANLTYAATRIPDPGAPDKLFRVSDFGARGDGIADDGPAVRAAVAAAAAAAPGSVLRFERSVYRLGSRADHRAHIVLDGVRGLAIDGAGATLVVTAPNTFFHVNDCRNVIVRGFTCDFDRPLHTQGTVRAVDPEEGFFDLEIHPGYAFAPGFPTDPSVLRVEEWGTVMDPAARHRKWGDRDHLFIESFEPVADRPGFCRVVPAGTYRGHLPHIDPGDRFAVNVIYPWTGTPPKLGTGHNLTVGESANCLFEDLTFYGGQAMNSAFSRNLGPITVRGMRVTFKPDTANLISTWRDGMHCKFNRGPLLVEHCLFEGLLDDSINIGTMGEFASGAVDGKTFILPPGFETGDTVLAYDPTRGRYAAQARVVETGKQTMELGRPTLFMHPPFKAGMGAVFLERTVRFAETGPVGITVGVGIDPRAHGSDGVTFAVLAGEEIIWRRHARWDALARQEFEVDAESLRGKEVSLRFAADPGIARLAAFDWGLWTRIEIRTGTETLDAIADPGTFRVGVRLDGSTEDRFFGEGFAADEPTGASVRPGESAWEVATVTFDREIPDAVPGRRRIATRFYNLSACGAGSVVRRNVFGPQRRHALLIRAPDTVFEENVVHDVGGSGVWASNEILSFEEGPLPENLLVRGNLFAATQRSPIMVRVAAFGPPRPIPGDVRIEDNAFVGLATAGIRLTDVQSVILKDNLVELTPAFPAQQPALYIDNILAADIDNFGVSDPRPGQLPTLGFGDRIPEGAMRMRNLRFGTPR